VDLVWQILAKEDLTVSGRRETLALRTRSEGALMSQFHWRQLPPLGGDDGRRGAEAAQPAAAVRHTIWDIAMGRIPLRFRRLCRPCVAQMAVLNGPYPKMDGL
jgi:hypothetical protein